MTARATSLSDPFWAEIVQDLYRFAFCYQLQDTDPVDPEAAPPVPGQISEPALAAMMADYAAMLRERGLIAEAARLLACAPEIASDGPRLSSPERLSISVLPDRRSGHRAA